LKKGSMRNERPDEESPKSKKIYSRACRERAKNTFQKSLPQGLGGNGAGGAPPVDWGRGK